MRTADALLEQYIDAVREKALTDAEQAPLWRAYKREPTVKLRLRLYEANLFKVVRVVLKAYPGAGTHLLDMVQDAALETLLPAIQRFDPDRGVPFGAYLQRGVQIQAARTYRRLNTIVKFAHTHGEVEAPTTVAMAPEVTADHVDEETPERLALTAELAAADQAALERAVDRMDEQERFVFREHLLEQRPLMEIRHELGISRGSVQSVWKAALARVRAHVARAQAFSAA